VSIISVRYTVHNTLYSITKELRRLRLTPVLGFDVECRSAYTAEEIQEAKDLLKKPELLDAAHIVHMKLVAKSSGLSYPSIIRTTHFIFGLSEEESVILIAHDDKTEMLIWNWLVEYKGKLLIHNAMFDLKICKERTGRLPVDFEDTMLLAKTYINNAENWKAKTGLKELVGGYYTPKWSMFEDYNIKNFNDPNFLQYCAIDGAAVVKLWNQLKEHKP